MHKRNQETNPEITDSGKSSAFQTDSNLKDERFATPGDLTAEQWWLHYYELAHYLAHVAMQEMPGKGILSQRQAEELVEKTLNQPAIRGMINGERPRKSLSKKLLRLRLNQNIVRQIQTLAQECQLTEESILQKELSDPIYLDVLRKHIRGAVKDALVKMQEYPLERKVLILRLFYRMTYAEIGHICDRSDQWASNTYRKGADRLKHLLKDWE